jgi:hypothetical protein
LAAKPIAAPPIAAAMIGPAPSLHEKALRVPLSPPRMLSFELLRFELDRFEVRLWVRVAIYLLLAWESAASTVRRDAPFQS